MFCINEIDQWLDKLEEGISVYSLEPIERYVTCAKEHNLIAQYFPVIDGGFIVYKDTTIFLTAEEGGTRLSIKPI